MNKLLPLCILSLFVLYGCVESSKSYARNHPQDGLMLKMSYCMDMQRYEGKGFEDVGCKVGHGNGKIGVKKDIIKKLVQRINIYRDSYEYTQLVGKDGLVVWFKDDSVGSREKSTVWQDGKGKLYIVFERED